MVVKVKQEAEPFTYWWLTDEHRSLLIGLIYTFIRAGKRGRPRKGILDKYKPMGWVELYNELEKVANEYYDSQDQTISNTT